MKYQAVRVTTSVAAFLYFKENSVQVGELQSRSEGVEKTEKKTMYNNVSFRFLVYKVVEAG